MLNILIATSRPEAMRAFADGLRSDSQVRIESVASGTDAVEFVRKSPPNLVVVDAGLPDNEPLKLVSALLMVNAMVNTAVVSPLSEEEFHEASEGLGILERLPEVPASSDAAELLLKLRRVLGMPV
jgi:DNA-binding response OmpR family regulator